MFFRATVERILIYGAECWTLTKTLQREFNRTYTKILRRVLNISWKYLPDGVICQRIQTKNETIKGLPTK